MQMGTTSAELMTKAGFNIEWHDYPMAHAVCGEEIAHIRDWLLKVYSAE
jgi:phospholipase/carboxylesterase